MNFRISKKWLWIGVGIITAVFVTSFLTFYFFFKTDYTPYGFYNVLINYLVLIGITVWSVGILYRLQQRTSWKLFLAVVFLVQGWLISSILKWTAEPGTGFARFMAEKSPSQPIRSSRSRPIVPFQKGFKSVNYFTLLGLI